MKNPIKKKRFSVQPTTSCWDLIETAPLQVSSVYDSKITIRTLEFYSKQITGY